MGSATLTTEPRLRDRALVKTIPVMPRALVQRLSAPYIAGATLSEAIDTVSSIAAANMGTTVDVLGEAISHPDEARATRDAYLAAIEALVALPLDASQVRNVSVKLTALGLGIDDELVHDNVAQIAAALAPHNGFVRIDMEDAPWTDATLDIYRSLHAAGHTNLGVVIQSYLFRSRDDVTQLAAERTPVRMVKGIYVEPASIAWHDMSAINASYLDCCRILLAGGSHVAFATHDDALIAGCINLVEELQIPTEQYEFQMLLGVREQRRDELVAAGHPLRVYVPFGAQWYEYSVRRLRENPRIAGHVTHAIIGNWARKLTPWRA